MIVTLRADYSQNILRKPRNIHGELDPGNLDFITLGPGDNTITNEEWTIIQRDVWGSHLVKSQLLTIKKDESK